MDDESYSDNLDSGDGTYSITNVPATSGTVLTVFLDSTPFDFNVEKGTTVTLVSGSDINDLDIYQDHVIARSDNGSVFEITHIDQYDFGDDLDVFALSDTSGSPYTLNVFFAIFYIWSGTIFRPVYLDFSTITLADIKILGTWILFL